MLGLRGAISRFIAESGFFMAAALAFWFLVCVVPLLLLGASTIGFVLSSEEAAQEVVNQLTRNFPVYRREISNVILRVVETRALSGIAGTFTLITSSTPLFAATRLVLHQMLGVRTAGGYVSNFLRDLGMVLGADGHALRGQLDDVALPVVPGGVRAEVRHARGAALALLGHGRLQRLALHGDVLLRLPLRAPPATAGVGGADRRACWPRCCGRSPSRPSGSTSARSPSTIRSTGR